MLLTKSTESIRTDWMIRLNSSNFIDAIRQVSKESVIWQIKVF